MTKAIEWGEAIEVSGRPEWLGDDEKCLPRWSNYWYDAESGSHVDCVAGWGTVTAIKLPADHPYYTVQRYNAEHGTSFVYWPGGDEAPGDWDRGAVLWSDLTSCYDDWIADPVEGAWTVSRPLDDCDIIGYTQKPQLITEEVGADVDTFTPCERTVRMCIDALPYPGSNIDYRVALEALLPKPARAEELVREWCERTGHPELTAMKDFALDLIERGEIK